MIRFRNPGSDVSQLINIFKLFYANLANAHSFDLNNMADIMTNENVASSSGYIGAQALEKSYERKDTSRNPLYNQAKAYAEIYRLMGWIVSSEEAALKFNFTFLGVHIATAGDSTRSLFEQCLMGVSYPNQLLSVKFKDDTKPFVNILKAASLLGGEICRDEIIIGPMNLSDGYNPEEVKQSADIIRKIRATNEYSSLTAELESQSESLNIQINTMQNSTRYVISALVYCGWFVKTTSRIYGSKRDFLRLTEQGKKQLSWLEDAASINGNDLVKKDQKTIQQISRLGFLQMLKRGGFIVDDELATMHEEIEVARSLFGKSEILFSPYQYFNKTSIKRILPEYETENGDRFIDFSVEQSKLIDYAFKSNKPIESKDASKIEHNSTERKLLTIHAECQGNTLEAVNQTERIAIEMKQSDFYPFVSELFQIIFALDARAPQAGVNNERFDVIIPDQKNSIPVEVKSPTEELMLSVKAVRQALENKIVMLSRFSQYPAPKELSTFAVGYNIPNERSDVHKLIEDIYNVYEINVAITNIGSLIAAAYHCLLNKKNYDVSDFKGVKGVINFADV